METTGVIYLHCDKSADLIIHKCRSQSLTVGRFLFFSIQVMEQWEYDGASLTKGGGVVIEWKELEEAEVNFQIWSVEPPSMSLPNAAHPRASKVSTEAVGALAVDRNAVMGAITWDRERHRLLNCRPGGG